MRRLKMNEVTLIISCLPFMIERMRHEKIIWKDGILEKMNHERTGELYTEETLKDFVIDVFDAIAKANKALFNREANGINSNGEIEDPYLEIERLLLHSRRKIYEMMEPIEKHAKEASKEVKAWFKKAGSAIDQEEQRRLLQRERPVGGGRIKASEDEPEGDDEPNEDPINETGRPTQRKRPHRYRSQRNEGVNDTDVAEQDDDGDDEDFQIEGDSDDDGDVEEGVDNDDAADDDVFGGGEDDDVEGDEDYGGSSSARSGRKLAVGSQRRTEQTRATKKSMSGNGGGTNAHRHREKVQKRNNKKADKRGKVRKSALSKPRSSTKSSIASLPNFHTSTHAPTNSRRCLFILLFLTCILTSVGSVPL